METRTFATFVKAKSIESESNNLQVEAPSMKKSIRTFKFGLHLRNIKTDLHLEIEFSITNLNHITGGQPRTFYFFTIE
jgi:hypothetical protein